MPEEQNGYWGFWMLRAVAAVDAGDEKAGIEAGKVLKRLGATESDKDAVINVMAALNIKGWLALAGIGLALSFGAARVEAQGGGGGAGGGGGGFAGVEAH